MQDRRQCERFPIYEPAGYQRKQELPIEGSIAEDISLTGLKLKVNEFIPQNSVIELQIHLPGLVQIIPARATVVWVKEIPYRDDSWELGLQLASNEPLSTAIRDYINLRRF